MLWVWPAAGAVLLARYGLVEMSIRRGVPLPYPKWFLFVLKFMLGFAIAVFVNIGVWFIEQLVAIDFEMLSISYIISELFLLGVHLVMNEYRRMSQLLKQVSSAQSYAAANTAPDALLQTPVDAETIAPERVELFVSGLNSLTPSEKNIYDAFIARATTKEIMANLNIKESTVKYHSRNLYGKLGVSSRKELLEVHKYIQSVKTKLEDTAE